MMMMMMMMVVVMKANSNSGFAFAKVPVSSSKYMFVQQPGQTTKILWYYFTPKGNTYWHNYQNFHKYH